MNSNDSGFYTEFELLELLRTKLTYGKTITGFAAEIGVSRYHLSKTLSGKVPIGPAIAAFLKAEICYRIRG